MGKVETYGFSEEVLERKLVYSKSPWGGVKVFWRVNMSSSMV